MFEEYVLMNDTSSKRVAIIQFFKHESVVMFLVSTRHPHHVAKIEF